MCNILSKEAFWDAACAGGSQGDRRRGHCLWVASRVLSGLAPIEAGVECMIKDLRAAGERSGASYRQFRTGRG